MTKRIFGIRPSKIGDSLMALPILNWLDIAFPGSYKIWTIAKNCSQSAQLYLNHPLIDRIHILELPEAMGQKDRELAQTCDIKFNLFPQHPEGDVGITSFWYNNFNIYEETFRMAGLPVEEYHKMPKELQVPKLEKWFDIPRHKKTIAIWAFAGYGIENRRNPSLDWYIKLIELIIQHTDFDIYQFGANIEPPIVNNQTSRFKRFNHLSFFEQIKITLGCDLAINTDSGSGIAIGAYGHPQINLLIRNAPGHEENFLAFAPKNCYYNEINLIGLDGTDSIKHEDVLVSINKI